MLVVMICSTCAPHINFKNNHVNETRILSSMVNPEVENQIRKYALKITKKRNITIEGHKP